MTDLTKRPDGKLERTLSNLRNLIDRYVPTVTQEAVHEMALRHESEVFDLLSTIYEYRERNQRLVERMDALEKELYGKVAVPVSLGRFTSSASQEPYEMSRRVSVRWSPDHYDMRYQISDWDLHRINPEETPHLFEMIGRQFEEHAKRELLPKLRAEFLKLYTQFKP